MRMFFAAAVLAAMIAPPSAFADEEKIEASTLDAITALATKGYQQPAVASIRNVHKSLARSGLGYCGEVSLESGRGFTVFHVILAGKDTAASVLRLADYPEADQSRNAVAVRRLMVNFGCAQPDAAPGAEPDTR